jgi:hypothetical protein
MKPARAFVSGVSVPFAFRPCAAFVSDAFHIRFALVPVLVHCSVSPCASFGHFVQSHDGVAVVEGETQEPKRSKRLSLNVGEDRRPASEWMPCGMRREVRHGEPVA